VSSRQHAYRCCPSQRPRPSAASPATGPGLPCQYRSHRSLPLPGPQWSASCERSDAPRGEVPARAAAARRHPSLYVCAERAPQACRFPRSCRCPSSSPPPLDITVEASIDDGPGMSTRMGREVRRGRHLAAVGTASHHGRRAVSHRGTHPLPGSGDACALHGQALPRTAPGRRPWHKEPGPVPRADRPRRLVL